jgi:hypothetical protein
MAYSQATLIRRVRAVLGDNPFTDICTEAMDTTETDLSVADTTKWSVGDIAEFSDDGERCLVTALFSATVLTVERGFLSATPGTGTAHNISTRILKSPVFQHNEVKDAIDSSIRALWPYVYKIVPVTITPVQGTHWYEIDEPTADNASAIVELSSVRQVVNGRMFSYGARRDTYPVRIHLGAPTGLAASGVALELPYLRSTGSDIFVRGIAPVTTTLSSTDYADLTEGIEVDAVMYLAVARMIAETGITRVTTEDIGMSDESVRPGTRESVAEYWDRKGVAARRQWELDLKLRNPRMQYYKVVR